MSRQLLEKLIMAQSLDDSEARNLVTGMMDGEFSPAQSAALLTALRMKGETPEELAAFASVMRERCTRVQVAPGDDLLDTCGTGGDGSGTFNISTATAFVASGMGLRVAKHGNRSVSSRCGSADVLEELGVNISLGPREMARCIDECGIGFLYAPALHPAMKQVAPVRRELGIRTFFNMLGPLSNPAGSRRQLIGCFSRDAASRMAKALAVIGDSRAMLVSSDDGLDEISISAPTSIFLVEGDKVSESGIVPEDFGLVRTSLTSITGGDSKENAAIIRSLLEGRRGAARDIVLANAAACAVLCGLATDYTAGFSLAEQSIDSGEALARLDGLVELSRAMGAAA